MKRISQTLRGTIAQDFSLRYNLYLPSGLAEKQDKKKWPVVFFLHGAGERGADLALVETHGLSQLAKGGEDFPFILVAPQCPTDWTWDRSLGELDCLLETILQEYPIDQERIYLTGLSMGGYGTWHWAARQTRAFAALVPICGGTMPLLGFPEKIAALKDVPVWVFHGEDDQVVPVARSKELVEVLESVGAPVRFTIYPGVGHNSWDKAYREPELIPWLLRQKNTKFNFEGGRYEE